MKSVRKRLTYANVMSSIAVFLVVAGGSALAAGGLGKNTVGSTQLKKNAVTAAKVKNNAITGGKIANGAVTGAKIGGGAVGASNLASNSVGSTALADNAVTGGKIAGNAVTEGKIADNAITSSKLANGSVTGSKIGAGAVGNGNLAGGSVNQSKLGSDIVAPRAIAVVEGATPKITSSTGEGVISVQQGTVKGFYCFNLSFTPKAMTVTDSIQSNFDFGVADPGASFLVCPSGIQASVIMVESKTGLADSTPQNFTVAFY